MICCVFLFAVFAVITAVFALLCSVITIKCDFVDHQLRGDSGAVPNSRGAAGSGFEFFPSQPIFFQVTPILNRN